MKLNSNRGSILAYSLIILGMMLAIATSISVAAIVDKKSASSTQSSVQALQTADSGVQLALKKINANLGKSVSIPFATCNDSGGTVPATVSDQTDAGEGKYTLSFFKADGTTKVKCTDLAQEIGLIKSVGTYNNTVRVVSVAVAAVDPCAGVTTVADKSVPSIIYNTVVGLDGKCWLDRNLGAKEVATAKPTNPCGNYAYCDQDSYGWLYQWGRRGDGHQYTAWGAQPSPVLSATFGGGPVSTPIVLPPNDVKFVTAFSGNYDWLSPQVDTLWNGVGASNNPCPSGFRVPAQTEWANLISKAAITNKDTAANSSLHIPEAGLRAQIIGNPLNSQGSQGNYWSSTAKSTNAYYLTFAASSVNTSSFNNRAYGFSVRCIKN